MVTATDVMLEHGISLGLSLGEVQEETSFVARDRFFFKQKTAYEIMPSLVGSEMCIRDRFSCCSWTCGGGNPFC